MNIISIHLCYIVLDSSFSSFWSIVRSSRILMMLLLPPLPLPKVSAKLIHSSIYFYKVVKLLYDTETSWRIKFQSQVWILENASWLSLSFPYFVEPLYFIFVFCFINFYFLFSPNLFGFRSLSNFLLNT